MIVDLAIVAFVGTLAWRGWRRGLLVSIARFVGFIVAAGAAVTGFRAVSPILRAALRLSSSVADFTAAALIFVGVTIGFFFAGRALTRLVRPTKWGTLNRAGGATFAGAWALSWVALVLLAISVIPAPAGMERQIHSSNLARAVLREAPHIATTLARTDLRRALQIFVPSERKLAVLATADYQHALGAEGELYKLVNAERRARGVRALAWDERLAEAARAHAADMYARGYFGHASPDGRTPADRLKAVPVPFHETAENIALAPFATIGHNQLMGSAEHRKNILSGHYSRVGIGVMFGPQGVMIDEEFTG